MAVLYLNFCLLLTNTTSFSLFVTASNSLPTSILFTLSATVLEYKLGCNNVLAVWSTTVLPVSVIAFPTLTPAAANLSAPIAVLATALIALPAPSVNATSNIISALPLTLLPVL